MDTLVFWISKLVWMILSPDSLLLLLLLAAWALLVWNRVRAARRLLGIVIAVLAVVAVYPVDEWIFYPLERHFPAAASLPDKVDGIILLGGAEQAHNSAAWNRPELNAGADRYFTFLALARTYPEAKLVFAGGSGNLVDQKPTEAEIASQLLHQQGISTARLLFESRSRNTTENIGLAKELAKPKPDETWVLVTSAYHMPRAVGSFCKASWPVIPAAADYRSRPGSMFRLDLSLATHLEQARVGLREWLGLAAYYAMGRTETLLPDLCLKN